MENKRKRVGIYIDGANIFYEGKRSGFKIDFNKLNKWVSAFHDIKVAKYFIGEPSWEPALSISKAFNNYLENIGYKVIIKPLKKLKSIDGKLKNKCNFDVEIHDEIIHDLNDLDIIYLMSGDSDFMRTKERVLEQNKRIKFIVYKKGCAWEIRKSWHIFLDDIRKEIER